MSTGPEDEACVSVQLVLCQHLRGLPGVGRRVGPRRDKVGWQNASILAVHVCHRFEHPLVVVDERRVYVVHNGRAVPGPDVACQHRVDVFHEFLSNDVRVTAPHAPVPKTPSIGSGAVASGGGRPSIGVFFFPGVFIFCWSGLFVVVFLVKFYCARGRCGEDGSFDFAPQRRQAAKAKEPLAFSIFVGSVSSLRQLVDIAGSVMPHLHIAAKECDDNGVMLKVDSVDPNHCCMVQARLMLRDIRAPSRALVVQHAGAVCVDTKTFTKCLKDVGANAASNLPNGEQSGQDRRQIYGRPHQPVRLLVHAQHAGQGGRRRRQRLRNRPTSELDLPSISQT